MAGCPIAAHVWDDGESLGRIETSLASLRLQKGLRRRPKEARRTNRGIGAKYSKGGEGSDLADVAAHGEDNRRGKRQITSHTPVDPLGVGGYFHRGVLVIGWDY